MTSSEKNQKYDFHLFDCKTPPLDTPQSFFSTDRISHLANDVKLIFPQYLELCCVLEQHEVSTRPKTVAECRSEDLHGNRITESTTGAGNNLKVEEKSSTENYYEENALFNGAMGSPAEAGNCNVIEKNCITERCAKENIRLDGAIEIPVEAGNCIAAGKNCITERSAEEGVHLNGAIQNPAEAGNCIVVEKNCIAERCAEDVHLNGAIGSPAEAEYHIVKEKITECCSDNNKYINGSIESPTDVNDHIETEERNTLIEYCSEEINRINKTLVSNIEVDNDTVINKTNVTKYCSEENVHFKGTIGGPAEVGIAIATERNDVIEYYSEKNNRINETVGITIDVDNNAVLEKSGVKENCSAKQNHINGTIKHSTEMGSDILVEKNSVSVNHSQENGDVVGTPAGGVNNIVIEKNSVAVCSSGVNDGVNPTEMVIKKNSVTECYREERINGSKESPNEITKDIVMEKNSITVCRSEERDQIVESPSEVVSDIALERNNVIACCADQNKGNAEIPPEMVIEENRVTEYLKENVRGNGPMQNPTEMVIEECCSEEMNRTNGKIRSDILNNVGTTKNTTDKIMKRVIPVDCLTPGTVAVDKREKHENVSNNTESKNNNINVRVNELKESSPREKYVISPGGKLNDTIASDTDEPKVNAVVVDLPLPHALKLATYVIQQITGKQKVFLDLDPSNLVFFFSDPELKHFSLENAYVTSFINKTHMWVKSLQRQCETIAEIDTFRVLRNLYYSRMGGDLITADERKCLNIYNDSIISDKLEIRIEYCHDQPNVNCDNFLTPLHLVQGKKSINSFTSPLVRDKETRYTSSLPQGPQGKNRHESCVDKVNQCSEISRPEFIITLQPIASSQQLEASMPSLDVYTLMPPTLQVQCSSHLPMPSFAKEHFEKSVQPSTPEITMPASALDKETLESSTFSFQRNQNINSSSTDSIMSSVPTSIPSSFAEVRENKSVQNKLPSVISEHNKKISGQRASTDVLNLTSNGVSRAVLNLTSNGASRASLNPNQALLQNEHNYTKFSATEQGNNTVYSISNRTYPNTFIDLTGKHGVFTAANNTSSLQNNSVSTYSTERPQLFSATKRKGNPESSASVAPPKRRLTGADRDPRRVIRRPIASTADAIQSCQPTPRKPPGRPPKKPKSAAGKHHKEANATPTTFGINGPTQPSQSTYTTDFQHSLVQNQGPQSMQISARNELNAWYDREMYQKRIPPRQVEHPTLASSARVEPETHNVFHPTPVRAGSEQLSHLQQLHPTTALDAYQLHGGSSSYHADPSLTRPERITSQRVMHNYGRQPMPMSAARIEFNQPYTHNMHNSGSSYNMNRNHNSGSNVQVTPGHVQSYHNYGQTAHYEDNFRRPSAPPPYGQHLRNQMVTPMYQQNSYYPRGTPHVQQPVQQQWAPRNTNPADPRIINQPVQQQWAPRNINSADPRFINASSKEGAVHSNRAMSWAVQPPSQPTHAPYPSGPSTDQHQQQQSRTELHQTFGSSSTWVPPMESRNTADRSRSTSRARLYSYLKLYRKPSHMSNSPRRSPAKHRRSHKTRKATSVKEWSK